MVKTDAEAKQELPSLKKLWGGWMLAIVAWVIHLAASYSLVEWYCHNQDALQESTVKQLLHLFTLLCAVLALLGFGLAWQTRASLVGSRGDRGYGRSRFMAQAGILISLLFALIIVVEGLPNLFLEPCM